MAKIRAFSRSVVFLLAFIACLQILFTEARPIKSMNKQGRDNNINVHQSKNTNDSQQIPRTAFADSEASMDDFRPTSPGFSPGVGHPQEITNSNVELSVEEFKDDHRPTKLSAAGPNPEVGHATKLHQSKSGKSSKSSQPKPSSHFSQSESGNDEISSTGVPAVNDFRPTPPGHSPGLGHHFSQDGSDGEIDPTPLGTGSGNNDTPTPGHSPGVGRPIINKSNLGEKKGSQPRSWNHIPDNAQHQTVPLNSNALHASAAASEDDFRPTSPGFSPGVGHPKTLITSSNIEKPVIGFKDDYRPTQPGHSPGVGHAHEKNDAEPNP